MDIGDLSRMSYSSVEITSDFSHVILIFHRTRYHAKHDVDSLINHSTITAADLGPYIPSSNFSTIYVVESEPQNTIYSSLVVTREHHCA